MSVYFVLALTVYAVGVVVTAWQFEKMGS